MPRKPSAIRVAQTRTLHEALVTAGAHGLTSIEATTLLLGRPPEGWQEIAKGRRIFEWVRNLLPAHLTIESTRPECNGTRYRIIERPVASPTVDRETGSYSHVIGKDFDTAGSVVSLAYVACQHEARP